MNCHADSFASRLKSILAVLVAVAITSACSASTVLKRPPAKNLMVLNTGNSRGAVHAELGAPSYTRDVDGEKVDTFSFDKGVSGGYKFGRAFFHVGADILTLCLWEIVGWPGEKIAAGPNTKVEVGYDKSEKIKAVNYLKKS